MPFLDTIKGRIGREAFSRIEEEAEREVAIAIKMALVDNYQQEQFYTQRFLLGDLLSECELFEKTELKILPTDIVNILFRCKLLFAAKTEDEYSHRAGGAFPMNSRALIVRWAEKSERINAVIDRHVDQLQAEIAQRTLLTRIRSFDSAPEHC